MKELEIDILYDTDETKVLEDIGLTVDIGSYNSRKHTFYRIDGIAPYYDRSDMAKIYFNGDNFVTPMSYEELKQLIRKTFG